MSLSRTPADEVPAPGTDPDVTDGADGAGADLFERTEAGGVLRKHRGQQVGVPPSGEVLSLNAVTQRCRAPSAELRPGERVVDVDIARGQRQFARQVLDPGMSGGGPSGVDDPPLLPCRKATISSFQASNDLHGVLIRAELEVR